MPSLNKKKTKDNFFYIKRFILLTLSSNVIQITYTD